MAPGRRASSKASGAPRGVSRRGGEHQELPTEEAPSRWEPEIRAHEDARPGVATPEGIGQEPGDHAVHGEARRVEVLRDRLVREGERVVGAVEVLAHAVPEVRAD